MRIDTPKEVEYFRHGGILPFVLRGLLSERRVGAASAPMCAIPRRPVSRLLTAPGPSGSTSRPPAAGASATAGRRAFAEVTHDTVGSTVARVAGIGDGPSVAVVGHIDEIGLIVHHIDDDGFLWFTGVGGWDPVILVGQRVEIATRDGAVAGVVGRKPPHLLREEERKKVPELRTPARRHRRARRRRGARARAHRRRRGDRGRAGRAAQRPRGLARDGQPARLLRGFRGGAAGRRGRRRARRRDGRRRRAGGDHVRAARARPRTRCGPTSRSWST